jgi:hypothetical protein
MTSGHCVDTKHARVQLLHYRKLTAETCQTS